MIIIYFIFTLSAEAREKGVVQSYYIRMAGGRAIAIPSATPALAPKTGRGNNSSASAVALGMRHIPAETRRRQCLQLFSRPSIHLARPVAPHRRFCTPGTQAASAFDAVAVFQQFNWGSACNGGPIWFLGIHANGTFLRSPPDRLLWRPVARDNRQTRRRHYYPRHPRPPPQPEQWEFSQGAPHRIH